MTQTRNVLVLGAAGRDFHNFNVFFRDRPEYRVVGFTAAQIPGIERRTYPPVMAGRLYPEGIPIFPESELAALVRRYRVDDVVFSYSDVAIGTSCTWHPPRSRTARPSACWGRAIRCFRRRYPS